ncbi:MAG: hypothetical protein JNK02_01190 [Planctomycetes bacterium]|nr:hypothetical protein [Planctomycetota bacterium]
MARLDRRTPLGALHVVGRQREVLEAAAELALERAREPFRGIARVDLAGADAVLKASPFHGKSALRWGLKHALGARLPRVNEHHNLSWLHERLFATPEPLAAGALVRRGLPRWQFLLTRHVADARQLGAWLAGGPPAAERRAVLDELAREVGRMHALRFVHRDLWVRNLLVVPPGGLGRLVFLDCWAGGPGPGWRGRGHDLACLESDLRALWTSEEARRWRALYAAERDLGRGTGAPPRPLG